MEFVGFVFFCFFEFEFLVRKYILGVGGGVIVFRRRIDFDDLGSIEV